MGKTTLARASPELLRQSSGTLAGRIAYHSLTGFSLDETGFYSWQRLWLRGGFPRSYLARSHSASDEWRREFIQTFLERDLPQLGISIRSTLLRRFWSMLAHYHGQLWNSSEPARAFGVADTTVRHYLDLLCSALVVQQLPPWHEKISKRQVKAPKVYIADSGLLHSLLGLAAFPELERHPKVGASWEGFVLNEVTRRLGARRQRNKAVSCSKVASPGSRDWCQVLDWLAPVLEVEPIAGSHNAYLRNHPVTDRTMGDRIPVMCSL